MKKTFTGNRSGEERLIHTDILSCLSKKSIELKQFRRRIFKCTKNSPGRTAFITAMWAAEETLLA